MPNAMRCTKAIEWHSRRNAKQWRNSSMGERATVSPAPEVIEWRNIVLAEHGIACGVSDTKYMTERSEWMLKWAQWIKCVMERSEVERLRAHASMNKRAQRDTLQCERSERLTSLD